MILGQLYTQLPIVFENVKFNRATTVPKDGKKKKGFFVLKRFNFINNNSFYF